MVSVKLLLAAVQKTCLAGSVALALMNAPPSQAQAPTSAFEVASIKLNRSADLRTNINTEGGRFTTSNLPLKMFLEEAYHVKDAQLLGAPDWIGSERYSIAAKMDDATAEAMQKLNAGEQREQLSLMLRKLFEDRLKLTVHHETRQFPVYALEVAKSGPKFKETTLSPADLDSPNPQKSCPGPHCSMPSMRMTKGNLTVGAMGLDMFAENISRMLRLPVLNKTGLKARYDFSMHWTPDDGTGQMFKGSGSPDELRPPDVASPSDASGPTFATALQEQLGLKLNPQKSSLDVVVIDHIERPSEN